MSEDLVTHHTLESRTPIGEWLREFRAVVEADAWAVELSDTAFNRYDQPHFVVQNGVLKVEGQGGARRSDLPSMLDASLEVIKVERVARAGRGPAILFWRILPEFDDLTGLYMRLSWARA